MWLTAHAANETTRRPASSPLLILSVCRLFRDYSFINWRFFSYFWTGGNQTCSPRVSHQRSSLRGVIIIHQNFSQKLKWTTSREVETQPKLEKLETSVKILRAERQLKLAAEATNFVELKQERQLKWAKYYLKIVFSRRVTKILRTAKLKAQSPKHQNSEQRLKLANSS